jgi:hypothetical protein
MATVGGVGEVDLVSTANGVSNDDGEGNYFAHLWDTAEERGIVRSSSAPTSTPTATPVGTRPPPSTSSSTPSAAQSSTRAPPKRRSREPPACRTSTSTRSRSTPARRSRSRSTAASSTRPEIRSASRKKSPIVGMIRVYEEPTPTATYGIAVDPATGRGRDNSAVYVVNFTSMAIAAEIKAKIDLDKLAFQLHYLGRWYGTQSGCEKDAVIAVETATGHGEAIIIPLRDGREGRPKYSNLYYHRRSSRANDKRPKQPGFRLNDATRTPALSLLQRAIRDELLPWLTSDLLFECRSFVHHDTAPRPAPPTEPATTACSRPRSPGALPALRPLPRQARQEADQDHTDSGPLTKGDLT